MSKAFSLRVQDFLPDAKTLSPGDFLTRHPSPVLLHRLVVSNLPIGRDTARLDFRSEASTTEITHTQEDTSLVVLPIVHSSSSTFAEGIRLGRTPVSDIYVPYPAISKLHCYFVVQGPTCTLVAVGSRNQSDIDGTIINAGQRTPLANGAQITLAHRGFVFLTAEAFSNLCRELAA